MTSSCSECGRGFKSETGVNIHRGHAHGKNTKVCVTCDEEFEVFPNKENVVEQCSDCIQKYGHTEKRNGQISESKEGYSHTEEAKQKMSESHTGKTLSESHRQSISEATSGEGNPMYGATNTGGQDIQTVNETGHRVRSGWEAEIDIILHDLGVDYEYEPQSFNLPCGSYTPDFIAGGVVIEVKGHIWRNAEEKAKQFMEKYPDMKYVSIGSELPSDLHIEWEDRSQVKEVVG